MEYKQGLQLQTPRLILRPLQLDDSTHMYALNADTEVLQYTGDKPFDSVGAAKVFLTGYIHAQKPGFGRMAVLLKSTNEFIGWCGFKQHDEYVDLGFRFFREHWGKGYATEAARASLTHGFTTLQLPEIVGRVATANTASIVVLKKLGMKFWKNAPCDGIQDAQYFKIDRSTYHKLTGITEIETLSLKKAEKEDIIKLWNGEYPSTVVHEDEASFDNYLNGLEDVRHLLLKRDDKIIGWFFTFWRDNERGFGMMLNNDWQGLGLGARMLRWAKKRYDNLNGWAVESNDYKKANGDSYPSPLAFYEKQGFKIYRDRKFITEILSTVKIEWLKTAPLQNNQ